MTPRLPLATILFTLGTYLGFSTFDAFCRMTMLQGVGQTQVLALVYPVALVPILLFVHTQRAWRELKPKRPGLLALRAGLSVLEMASVFFTLRHLSMAASYTLFLTLPLWTALLGGIFLGELLRWRQLVGILCGFAGVVIAMNPGVEPLSLAHITGLLAGLLGGIAVVIMRPLGKSEHVGTILIALFCTLCLVNASLVETWRTLTGWQVVHVLCAGLALSAAHLCFYHAIRRAPAPLFAPFQYTQILWMVVYGAVLFHETPDPRILLGLLLVSFGGWLLIARSRRAPAISLS